MERESGGAVSTTAGGLSLIERVSEAGWTLQFLQAVLFLDLALAWFAGHGVLWLSVSGEALQRGAGMLLVGVLAFAVFASLLVPLAGEAFRFLIVWTPLYKWLYWDAGDRRPPGHVRPRE